MATGGDDCTIKIWKLDQASLTGPISRQPTETDPQTTLRAHTAPITALVHSPNRRLLYSASLDSTIRVWHLPAQNRTPYASFEASTGVPAATLVGHTDAVWDILLVPTASSGDASGSNTLISCGAEGSVKVWDVSGGPFGSEIGGKLALSWGYNGTEAAASAPEVASSAEGEAEKAAEHEAIGATSIAVVKTDMRRVAVAYRNAVVKIFEIDTGKEVQRLASDVSYGMSILSLHSTRANVITQCFCTRVLRRWY